MRITTSATPPDDHGAGNGDDAVGSRAAGSEPEVAR